MAKVDLELVKMVLQRNELDIRLVSQILEDINQELTSEIDEEKPPPVKKQYVIMISDPNGYLQGKDMTGWVLQIPEEDSPHVAEEKLIKSAYAFNTTPKGRRMPVKTVAEVCEVVSARILKEEHIWVKSKEPVLVVKTNNKIPMDTGLKSDQKE